jgi:two-component system NtrC family sensor kinase
MSDAFDKLPTILLGGILLLIFASMRKQNQTLRFRLWLYAWILIFSRFCAQLWYETTGMPPDLYLVIDLAILQVAGILFLVSVSVVSERRIAPYTLIAVMAAPMIFYAAAMVYGFAPPWAYALCLLAVSLGGCGHAFYAAGRTAWNFLVLAVFLLLAAWGIVEAYRGHPAVGFHIFMTFIYAFAGALFLRKFRRLSAGVVTTSAGFLGWAVVGPIAYWNTDTLSRTPENIAIWSLPKFVVAIGMIVTLLEDERLAAEAARTRERLLNQQMRRFSELTSHLLSGVDVASFADKIAQVISGNSDYQTAVLLLVDTNRSLYVAGQSGASKDDLKKLQEQANTVTEETLIAGAQIGLHSYRSQLLSVPDPRVLEKQVTSQSEPDTDEIVVPLRSPSGVFMGLIVLARPRSAASVRAGDLSTIEVLARDLAGAIEHTALQAQLVRSEKMAGIGQLVAGVAHELNNPLTAVLGYTELLTDQVSDVAVQRELGIIRKEATRMKRIIENLQRFSRQQKVERRTINLSSAVEELLKLRSYDIQTRGVQIDVDIDPHLSKIVADDTLLNQVLLNVLNNAIEAVELSKQKRVLIEGRTVAKDLQLRVMDSGPGFTDVNRVFDPFYTTKAPGKGTGLGLSICYGIIKEHGGEITASNPESGGACITIKLPLNSSEPDDVRSADEIFRE